MVLSRPFMLMLIQWCHMVATPILVAPCDANVDANSSTQQQKFFALHLNCLKLRKAMVPLMMLLASCVVDARITGIKQPNSHVAPHFNCLDLRNAMFLFLVPLALMMQTPGTMLHFVSIILTKQMQ